MTSADEYGTSDVVAARRLARQRDSDGCLVVAIARVPDRFPHHVHGSSPLNHRLNASLRLRRSNAVARSRAASCAHRPSPSSSYPSLARKLSNLAGNAKFAVATAVSEPASTAQASISPRTKYHCEPGGAFQRQ